MNSNNEKNNDPLTLLDYCTVREILFDIPSSESSECLSLYLMDVLAYKSFFGDTTLLVATVDLIRFHLVQIINKSGITEENALYLLNFVLLAIGEPVVDSVREEGAVKH